MIVSMIMLDFSFGGQECCEAEKLCFSYGVHAAVFREAQVTYVRLALNGIFSRSLPSTAFLAWHVYLLWRAMKRIIPPYLHSLDHLLPVSRFDLTHAHAHNKMETVATLQRISRERLSSLLLSPESSKVAIVDVRDDDHVGGHIRSSIHVPSSTLNYRSAEIVDTLADKEIVVFHCSLSQQRGPGAALRYLRERDSKLKKQGVSRIPGEADDTQAKKEKENQELEKADQGEEVDVTGSKGLKADSSNTKTQEVFVLDGGFVQWQEK